MPRKRAGFKSAMTVISKVLRGGKVIQIPGVGAADPLAERDLRAPAQGVDAGYVQQLAGRAVGLGGIEDKLPL